MPELGETRHDLTMRTHALEALAELTSGRFAERMRLDAAARLLIMVRRVLTLRRAGILSPILPRPAQRRAVLEVERIGARWNPGTTTAAEFIGDLPPADIRLLVELAPIWADAAAAAA